MSEQTHNPPASPPATADVCDARATVCVALPVFRDYGGVRAFGGRISTVQCFEDNTLVREALETPGAGRVLVIDGGGSLRRALLGDVLAALAAENGWAGVVVNGCIRDAAALSGIAVGVKALATCPLKSVKRGAGRREVPVRFAGVEFAPGRRLYADADGVVVAAD